MSTLKSVAERASTPDSGLERRCSVPGCEKLTERSAGTGLSRRLCPAHARRQAQHGTAHGGSFKAYLIRPHIIEARRYLKNNRQTELIRLMVSGMRLVLANAVSPTSVTWGGHLSPQTKARLALGRLVDAGATPEDVLAIVLGVLAMCRRQGVISGHYISVQVGKALMRRHGIARRGDHVKSTPTVLRLVGRWGLAFTTPFMIAECLEAIVRGADRRLPAAERAEQKRRDKARVRHKNEAWLARRIGQMRNAGYGPADLTEIELNLRQRYGIVGRSHG